MSGRKYIYLFVLFIFLFFPNEAKAGVYDNAYSFYSKYGTDNEPAHMNENDGYIYFCSWGNKSVSGTKYKTVGYTITININGKKDSVEVKLGGNIVKNVSTVTKDNVTYVLRRARLSRLQELFNGNSDISWYQIFRRKNQYQFDAIMTVVEKGNDLCGKVEESSNNRTISAGNNSYLFRRLSDIKTARKWNNPSDLDNFYGRNVEIAPVSPLVVSPIYISGNNIYGNNGVWYVKKDSQVNLSLITGFDDTEALTNVYHPNYNVYRISGWGDDRSYCVKQGSGGNDKGASQLIIDGKTNNKPLTLIDIDTDNTTTYEDAQVYFQSMVKFSMNVPNAETVYVEPEGRVYYDSNYPAKNSEEINLCDVRSNPSGKITMISDDTAPEISVPNYAHGYEGQSVAAPGAVTDNGAGLEVVRLYRSDGTLLFEKEFDEYCTYYLLGLEYSIIANKTYSYYLYAMDNVGNESYSSSYKFSTPRAHTVVGSIVGGYNGYNAGKINVDVFGGNSEISSIVIMSEDDKNPSKDRVIITNKCVEAHTLPAGLYQYNHFVDAMDTIKDLPDGLYEFDVISGGRYVASEPVVLTLNKDTTPPSIKCLETGKNYIGWHRKNAVIEIQATDNLSGVNDVKAYCNGECIEEVSCSYGQTTKKYVYKYNITKEGINSFEVAVSDKAGNVSNMRIDVKVDASPPTYSLYGGLSGIDNNDGKWISKNQLEGGIMLYDIHSGIDVNKADDPLMISEGGVMRAFDKNYYTIIQNDFDKAAIYFTKEYIDRIKSSKNKFTVYQVDRVKNILNETFYINVDCDPPKLSYPDTDAWDINKCKGNIVIEDEHSGVYSVSVKCDNEVIKSFVADASHRYEIGLDLHEYMRKANSITILTSDGVGNMAEYPLEFIKKSPKKIRTRVR